ncbi:MAG: recombination regulator RecX [Propionibacteriaceae bacterium]|jgi:regulatory protein|nr:recombination regulator RecX [Propionibacteriaceae bacterium]
MLVVEEEARDPYEVAREAALRLLDVRERSVAELRELLRRRGYPDAAIEKVLARLSEIHLLDDARFARLLTKRCQVKLRSRVQAAIELERKGVSKELAAAALEEYYGSAIGDETPEREIAIAYARKRIPSLRGLPYEKAYPKLARALSNKGFSTAVAVEVTKAIMAELAGENPG